jgi:DNA-binding response OmpR family regulator
MLSYLLGSSDFKVELAETIEEALGLAQEHEFDLYVLDKRFPDGTGLELCQKLRELTPGVPVIFYSGDAYHLQQQEGLAAGADAYIAKPYIDELLEAVNMLLVDGGCTAAQV